MLPVGYVNTTNTDSVSVYNRLKNFIEQCFSLAHNLQLSLLFTELELKNRGPKQLDPFTFSEVGKDNIAFSTFTVLLGRCSSHIKH
mmetsp:Transcript_31914/g.48137  ORF Transcript_31914/g.48137 Transcript_31914/m.48137 type:complete len:86 (+) Transcript_31914:276-533(+)